MRQNLALKHALFVTIADSTALVELCGAVGIAANFHVLHFLRIICCKERRRHGGSTPHPPSWTVKPPTFLQVGDGENWHFQYPVSARYSPPNHALQFFEILSRADGQLAASPILLKIYSRFSSVLQATTNVPCECSSVSLSLKDPTMECRKERVRCGRPASGAASSHWRKAARFVPCTGQSSAKNRNFFNESRCVTLHGLI